ncbi:hypothetical protein [Saccharothrix coeruleofusca]|uniref:Uncharacterized protein n=1 Tax=Saccharothrix coeruleofusca TaxID=33919 RepID=A0A918AHT6_9PSEU|nr:hypothetical protein [Saccharothrix coeruleofusca]GGP39423.1 hypothetical protein GCM10010185_08710 [Saccharothrix coeruleofusca]
MTAAEWDVLSARSTAMGRARDEPRTPMRRVEELRPQVREIVAELIDTCGTVACPSTTGT